MTCAYFILRSGLLCHFVELSRGAMRLGWECEDIEEGLGVSASWAALVTQSLGFGPFHPPDLHCQVLSLETGTCVPTRAQIISS